MGGLLDEANFLDTQQNDSVLAMDELTDDSDRPPALPPFVVEPVQIVDFPNFYNLQRVIPLPEDEI